MDEEQDWFEEYFATDAGSPTADEAATEAAAPGDDALRETETPPTEPDVATDSYPDDDDPEPLAADSDEAESASEPEPTGPAPIDWTRPELQPLLQAQQRWDALQQQAEQIRQMKQASGFQQAARELVDDDPERLQQFHGLVAQVAAPAVQERDEAVRHAHALGKTFSAFWNAAKANLSSEQLALLQAETDALMGVDDPHLMERMASGKKETERAYRAQLTERDNQITELKRQLAANQQLAAREASGADLVDSGTGGLAGSGSREDRMRAATDMDGYFAGMFGEAA